MKTKLSLAILFLICMGSYINIESVISLNKFKKDATTGVTLGATDGKSGGWARGDEHKLHIQNTSKYPIKVEVAYRSGDTGPRDKKSVIIPPHQKGICKFYYTIGEVTVTYKENSAGQLPEKKERTKDFKVTMSEAEKGAIIASVAVGLAIATVAIIVFSGGTATGAAISLDIVVMGGLMGGGAAVVITGSTLAAAAISMALLGAIVAGVVACTIVAGTAIVLSENAALQGEHEDIKKANLLVANDYAILNGLQV